MLDEKEVSQLKELAHTGHAGRKPLTIRRRNFTCVVKIPFPTLTRQCFIFISAQKHLAQEKMLHGSMRSSPPIRYQCSVFPKSNICLARSDSIIFMQDNLRPEIAVSLKQFADCHVRTKIAGNRNPGFVTSRQIHVRSSAPVRRNGLLRP